MTLKNNQVKVEKLVPNSIQDLLKEHLNITVDFEDNLSESQKVAFKLFKENKNLVILGSAGTGKCHGVDTPILMFDGTIKKVQDIQLGEVLMGDDSTPRNVLSLSTGKDIMYKITNVKGESYIVNSEHILSLKMSNKKIIKDRKERHSYQIKWFDNINLKYNFKTLSYKNKNKEKILKELTIYKNDINENLNVDISIKDYLKLDKNIKKYLKGYKVAIEFLEKDLPLDPYMIGFWLGDGTSNTSEITTQDSTIIKYFKTNLEKYKCYLQFSDNMKYRINGEKSKGCLGGNNHFINCLKEYNLINNKHIPNDYKCNSRQNRLKLLAGLLDSDGNLDKNKSGYEFTQGLEHEKIIDDVIYLARSLGFACYKNKKQTTWTHKEIKKQGEAWRICISGKGIDEIPVLCPRKKANPRQQIKDVLISGIKVEELREDNYYGFEVDNNHRYVMGDFIVTHNSCIIKTMEEYIKTNKRDYKIYLCSTTGISAFNIGGLTIHSFMGIGTGDIPVEALIRKVNRKKKYRDRIISTDILVIDEVSMLSAELFEKLNRICQAIKKSKQFFGGIQIILTGDLNQMCPVFNRNIEFTKGEEQDTRLIIESPEFTKEFNKKNGNIIVLKENFRQKNDPTFINLLSRIRVGKHTEEDITVLKNRLDKLPKGKMTVNLVSSNRSAQIINDSNVSKIKEPVNKYTAIYKDSGKEPEVDELLIKELKFQFKQKGIDTLELKKGTRVMLTKNLDTSIGLVNGSIGTIESFIQVENRQEYPVVMFDNDIKQLISPVSIELELDGCKASATQIPLMLAYAITIHRAQSLTLDSAVLDLADCFADAQVYVALSRLKSLDGLYLKSFNPTKIKVNKKMTEYLNNL